MYGTSWVSQHAGHACSRGIFAFCAWDRDALLGRKGGGGRGGGGGQGMIHDGASMCALMIVPSCTGCTSLVALY